MAIDRQGRAVVAGETNAIFTLGAFPRRRRSSLHRSILTATAKPIFRSSARQPANGGICRSSDGGNAAFTFGNSTDKIVPGDFTGDGKTDIAFWRPSTGEWFILRSEDVQFYSFPFGTIGDIPAAGDFDGDGKADAAVFRPSEVNLVYPEIVRGGTTIAAVRRKPATFPLPADYDGDGKADIAIYRPSARSNGGFERSSDGNVFAFQFGNVYGQTRAGRLHRRRQSRRGDSGDLRPANGLFCEAKTSSFYSFPFGATGDMPGARRLRRRRQIRHRRFPPVKLDLVCQPHNRRNHDRGLRH